MKKIMLKNEHSIKIVVLALFYLFCAQVVTAATTMNDYCSIPPFVATGNKPNLMLMIDNSASMYDLAFTDTVNLYCANAPTTACNAGTTCGGTAYCLASGTTVTTTTTTLRQCTVDTDCPQYVITGNSGSSGCPTTGPNKYTCKNSLDNITTTTVTFTPTTCTQDSTCNAITPGDTCNNKCNVTHSCLDDTYVNTASYKGYFVETAVYQYSSAATGGTYPAFDEFDGDATMPSSCTYGGSGSVTPFVCVNVDAISGKVSKFVATGKFLNWLTMSKFDIEKEILTGGKYDSSTGDLVAESRGCAGRKFIKLVPGMSGLTFAIRGGSTTGVDKITNQATEYGTTYIEIYQGTYNSAACSAAQSDWQNVNTTNLGIAQGDSKCCLAGGTQTIGCNPSSAQLIVANQAIHDCYWYYNGHGLSNLQPIMNACVNDWGLVSAATITDFGAGDAICSSVLPHADSLVWSSLAAGYEMGYLGLCYNTTTGKWDAAGGFDANCSLKENKDFCASLGGAPAVADPPSNLAATGTLQNVPGFIMEAGLGSLTRINDYTSTGFNPNGTPRGIMQGFRVYVYDPAHATTWPPRGLIYKYRDSILFGAMTFNNNGSASECADPNGTPLSTEVKGSCSLHISTSCTTDSGCPDVATGEKCIFPIPCAKVCQANPSRQCSQNSDCASGDSCISLTKRDGAKILTNGYIGGTCSGLPAGTFCTDNVDCPTGQTCLISVGDHYSGLIKDIDAIVASTWTPFAEGLYNALGYFARDSSGISRDFRFQTSDYVLNKNPSNAWCRPNFLLLITDGMSTADVSTKTPGPDSIAKLYATQYPAPYNHASDYGYDATNKCPQYAGSRSLAGLSWIGQHTNIGAFSTSVMSYATPTHNNQFLNTLVVYSGPTNSIAPGLCDPYTLMNQTAVNGSAYPMYTAQDTSHLESTLDSALGGIAAKAASGSAVSVLTTSARGVGSMLQAYFFPTLTTQNLKQINWVGYVQNIWIDPMDNIRDDYSGTGTADAHLILNQDRVMKLNTDLVSGATKVGYFSTLADGSGGDLSTCTTTTVSDFNKIIPIWEGGYELAKVTASDSGTERHIFTALTGTSGMGVPGGITFDVSHVSQFSAALNPDPVYTADDIVRYTRGMDLADPAINSHSTSTWYRYRLLTVPDPATGLTSTVGIWKLGDVINSTPRVVGNIPANTYYLDYGDASYYSYISSNDFQHRSSVAIIGSNDGMLHAFKLGYLKDRTDTNGVLGTNVKALFRDYYGETDDDAHAHLGGEAWAYIPYNALPFLKYYAKPEYANCHIYAIDLSVKIFDVSIGDIASGDVSAGGSGASKAWRTILIGGMRFGGSCPLDTTTQPGPPIPGVGFSSYFALDLTDYLADTSNGVEPSLNKLPIPLWEFTDPDLGYTTSSPAIIRSGNPSTNGNWYVVFGSGPTQLPKSNFNQDIARNKPGYIYVLDLKTGGSVLKKKIQLDHNAVVSDILTIDADKDYSSEKAYFGTTYCDQPSGICDSTNPWKGKIMRLSIPSDVNTLCSAGSGTFTTCSHLKTLVSSKYPFTASPDAAKDELGNTWVYAGSGKYFSSLDEQDASQQIFLGFIDSGATVTVPSGPAATCPTTCPAGTLCDVTSCVTTATVPTVGGTTQICTFDGSASSLQTIVTSVTNPSSAPQSLIGWVNFLQRSNERVISRPLAAGGVIDFLSYVPISDVCRKGGDTYLFALDYKTGVAAPNVAIRAVGSTTNSSGNVLTSGSVVIQKSVKLGAGAPPTGEAIIITPPKEGQEKLKKKIQVSTGVIVETENKPAISTVSKIINWLKK